MEEFVIRVKVRDDLAPKFRELTELPDSGNVLLACEVVIGAMIDSDAPSYTHNSLVRQCGGSDTSGADIVEVEMHDDDN